MMMLQQSKCWQSSQVRMNLTLYALCAPLVICGLVTPGDVLIRVCEYAAAERMLAILTCMHLEVHSAKLLCCSTCALPLDT